MGKNKKKNAEPTASTSSTVENGMPVPPKVPAQVPTIAKEDVEKTLEGLTPEDKVAKLLDRLVSAENERAQFKAKSGEYDKMQKYAQQLEKKVEKTNSILVKTEESKSKLEELCRGLQKYNKEIREEGLSRAKKLEAERQDAVHQLRNSLKDIEKNMNEGRDRSDTLAADNSRLSERLTELGSQYEERLTSLVESYKKKEEYFGDLMKARDCEIELLKTRLQAAALGQQKAALEKDELARSLLEGTQRVGQAIENETQLREQVKQYADRYTELADSLSKSSAAFDKFKKEIDRVNLQLKKVELEATNWKVKYEESNKIILVMTVQKKDIEERALEYEKKVTKLENLCRALTQRNGSAEKAEKTPEPSS